MLLRDSLNRKVDSKRAVDAEIISLVEKLNRIPGVATLFSCAGYGELAETSPRRGRHRVHSHRELVGAYLVVRYTASEVLHLALSQLFGQVTEMPDGRIIYDVRKWNWYNEGDRDYLARLARDSRFYAKERRKVEETWEKVEKLLDEVLACASPARPGRRRSTSSSSNVIALSSSGTAPIAGRCAARSVGRSRISAS